MEQRIKDLAAGYLSREVAFDSFADAVLGAFWETSATAGTFWETDTVDDLAYPVHIAIQEFRHDRLTQAEFDAKLRELIEEKVKR